MPTKILKEIVEFFGKKLDNMSVEIKGAEVVTIKGIQGEQGIQGVPGKDGADGKDSKVPGPKGADGKDGKDGVDGKDGRDGVDGKDGKDGARGKDGLKGKAGRDGSPDTGEEIIQKINKDKSDRLIRKSKVEGMDEIESLVRTAEVNSRWLGGGGSFVYAHDLSDSLNGVLTTFALPANARVIMVFSSSTPGVLRPTVDYTTTASTITFTSQIEPSTTLSAGQTVMVLYKIL